LEPFGFDTFCFETFQSFETLRSDFFSVEKIEFGIQCLKGAAMSVFDEKYRVVAVKSDRLLLKGVLSGDVLTIVNSEPDVPLTQEEYPLGRLISLTDPSTAPLN
jgi:hypothetical protein